MKPAQEPARLHRSGAARPQLAEPKPHLRLVNLVHDAVAAIDAASGTSGASAAAGVAVLHDGGPVMLAQLGQPPTVLPWRRDPALVHAVRVGAEVVRHDGNEGHWLLAAVWVPQLMQPWMMWTARRERWTDAQARAFVGEAAKLGQRLPEACAEEVEAARQTAFMDQAARISGRLAHDFGNVLTGILGFTELTLTQLAAESPPHRYLTEVWQASRAGAAWVHQLQLFGRRSIATQSSASLGDIVAALLRGGDAGVRVETALPDDLPAVAMDEDSLRQAVAHLHNNAREACAKGGSVTLAARVVTLSGPECLRWIGQPHGGQPHGGAMVEVSITDTGTGMSAAVKDKLFRELFFSSKPRHRGLGLAVVFGIVRAYGGGLRLEDCAPSGTLARLVLPIVLPTGAKEI